MSAIYILMFVLLPASVFAFLPTRARRAFLAAVAVAFITAALLWGRATPDNQLLIVPLALLGAVVGGLLVEAVLLVKRLFAKKGQIASHG